MRCCAAAKAKRMRQEGLGGRCKLRAVDSQPPVIVMKSTPRESASSNHDKFESSRAPSAFICPSLSRAIKSSAHRASHETSGSCRTVIRVLGHFSKGL